ncbi:SUMF1/EgtB/PvdO family nonheme iron enzyme [Vibrio sp. CDRSL-10 TSBA]
MQHKWLGIVGSVIILTACNSNIEAKSDVVSQNKIDEIIHTVNNLYPDTEQSLKQKIVNVAVKSIENMVFIEGGSFMMGDFLMPCENEDLNRPVWTPDSTCLSDFFSVKNGSSHLHKVTLDSYSLSKFETEMLDLDVYFQTLDMPFVQRKIDGKPMLRSESKLKNFVNWPAKTRKWQEAKDYCQWVGKITSLPFDLPTEAQWEYAARSRGKNLYYATNNGFLQHENGKFYDKEIGFYRNFNKDEVNVGNSMGIDKVGSFPPKPLRFI